MQSMSLLVRATTTVRTVPVLAVLSGVLGTTACSTLRVHSLPAPNADFAGRRTFRIVDPPAVRPPVDALPAWSEKPMLNNSIINQHLREDIRRAFEARGYVMTTQKADFNIAYYANARERIDFDNVGYYSYYGRCCDVYEYTEGTVIIDVVDPATKRLIWRGSGVAEVSDNPRKYLRKLEKAVNEIVRRYPAVGVPAVVASRAYY